MSGRSIKTFTYQMSDFNEIDSDRKVGVYDDAQFVCLRTAKQVVAIKWNR